MEAGACPGLVQMSLDSLCTDGPFGYATRPYTEAVVGLCKQFRRLVETIRLRSVGLCS